MHAGGLVRLVDDAANRPIVDALFAHIWRERDRRLVDGLAIDDKVPARQVFREAAQLHARKDHLRAGRADVDADREQRDVVLCPEARLGRVVLAAGIVMIVVVIRLAVLVRVHRIEAEQMILERVLLIVYHLLPADSCPLPTIIGTPWTGPRSKPPSSRAAIPGRSRTGP